MVNPLKNFELNYVNIKSVKDDQRKKLQIVLKRFEDFSRIGDFIEITRRFSGQDSTNPVLPALIAQAADGKSTILWGFVFKHPIIAIYQAAGEGTVVSFSGGPKIGACPHAIELQILA